MPVLVVVRVLPISHIVVNEQRKYWWSSLHLLIAYTTYKIQYDDHSSLIECTLSTCSTIYYCPVSMNISSHEMFGSTDYTDRVTICE